jgi:hypothetical protein
MIGDDKRMKRISRYGSSVVKCLNRSEKLNTVRRSVCEDAGLYVPALDSQLTRQAQCCGEAGANL